MSRPLCQLSYGPSTRLAQIASKQYEQQGTRCQGDEEGGMPEHSCLYLQVCSVASVLTMNGSTPHDVENR
jgi:hypothetical protein